MQQYAFCVVSDSGTLPEEGSYFKFPAVSIRTSTERPEAMERGYLQLVVLLLSSFAGCGSCSKMHRNDEIAISCPAYDDINVSIKVVKLIQSYTGIINRMVWRKA